jgi:NADPH:quinone reductase-like Zn-dependent oxidoreductase
MRAVQFTALNQLSLATLPSPVPGPGEVRVRLRAAALNHRDLWIKLGQYAGITYPCTPGSDGAGVVEAVGPDVDRTWLDREVIINPSFDWGDREEAQGPHFSILGLPRAGTLAEEIAVPVAQLSPRPAQLSWVEAAALPLTQAQVAAAMAALDAPGRQELGDGEE